MNVFVAGGAGFIGSHFINELLIQRPDAHICCLDALSYAADLGRLQEALRSPGVRFCHGSICDTELVACLMEQERPDIVINFAAETHVDRAVTDPEAFIQSNIVGAYTLLKNAKRYGVSRFHQVSTDEVYGSISPGSRPADEQFPLCPSNPYAAAKASADLLALSYFHTYQLPVTISRCSNNYGEWQYPEKLVPLAIKRIVHGEAVPVYGTGLNVRNWIYVKDHCAAINLILKNGRPGEIYNIGSDEAGERTNLELLHMLLRIFGKSDDILEHVTDRPGHDRRYAIDTGKIRKELGWASRVLLDEGLRKTAEWYAQYYAQKEMTP